MAETVPADGAAARKLRSAVVWRLLHRLLPLGQRFNPLIAAFIRPCGLIAIPWNQQWLTIDASWLTVPSTASAPVYRTPQWQNPEFFALVAPMLARCDEGAVVDVGANIGVYTLNFRDITSAPITAFEPNPAIFALLARNVGDNALSAVTIRNVACGDYAATLDFHGGINGAMAGDDAGDAVSVPVVRLDDELRDTRVGLIKIDCEGYEWQVLSGCRDLIAAEAPALFVELHPKLIMRYGHSLADVCDLLRPHYRLEFWELDPAQRAPLRWRRFLSHYQRGLRRYADEQMMLTQVACESMPDQVFLCATPRHARS